MKRFLVATLAALGLCAGSAPLQQITKSSNEQVAVKNGQDTKKLESDHFGSYAGGMLSQIMRSSGHAPYEWGISRQCFRMVQKNKKIARRAKR